MFEKVSIYLRNQSGYFLFLFFLFVVPLALFFQFSTYPLPKVQYVFIGAMVASQYIFYREKDYLRKVEPKAIKQLQKELSRVPSSKEVNLRLIAIAHGRSLSIGLNAFLILLVMFWYKQF